jgi:carboxypeptidase C (cathepsin A)
MGTENGPFYIGEQGTPIHHNPYSWNKIANMLYVEIPAGVGFSYTDSPYDKITGDAQTSLDNFYVILEFFKRFPERAKNDFYIASESYGGHYIPQLALDILRRDYESKIAFKGFLVGNPYVDPYTNEIKQFEAYYSHGLIAKPLFEHWRQTCDDPVYYDSDEVSEVRLHSEPVIETPANYLLSTRLLTRSILS